MPKRRHESSGEDESNCDNYEERPDYYEEYYDNDEDDSDGQDEGDEDNIEIVESKRRNVRTGDEDTDEDEDEERDEEYDGTSEVNVAGEDRVGKRLDQSHTRPKSQDLPGSSLPTSSQPSEPEKTDKLDCYKQLLRIVRPEETVQKCIQRLGSMIPRRPVGKKNSKQSESQLAGVQSNCSAEEVNETRKKLSNIIDLAHELFSDGDLNIYIKNFEDLEEAIN